MDLPVLQNDAEDPLDLLDMCVEGLHDKRGPTPEHAMKVLVGALERHPPLDEHDSRSLAIFTLCGVSIKKAAARPKEARLAYRAVGLLALTLRAGSSDLLDQSFSLLSEMLAVQVSHDDAPTLVAALDCLAAVAFAGAVDTEDVELPMKAIWTVIFPPASRCTKLSAWKTNSQVLVAAVSAWTFLLTTVTITPAELKANRAAWNAIVASLAELLENDDRTVRMAAGKALAVCMELNLTQHVPRKDKEALVDKVRDLAAEAGGQGANKTMLSEQRHLFRQIVAFVDHDERPKDSVTVRVLWDGSREMLRVSTWAKLVQLSFLRRFLRHSFLKHVQDNELFNEAFDIIVEEAECSTALNRKAMNKKKDKHLNLMRNKRWECMNDLCLESGDPY